MSDRNGASGRDDKKHRLDELFADQPFLSPTMKARLLHERLQEPGRVDAGDGPATSAPDLLADAARLGPPAPDTVSLADAPVYLAAPAATLRQWADSGRISRSCAARLLRLRDGDLDEWRRGML